MYVISKNGSTVCSAFSFVSGSVKYFLVALRIEYSIQLGRSTHSYNIKINFYIKTQPGWEMSIYALLVPTLKNQMSPHCKPYWRASIKEQNQKIVSNTLKKDVYCQQSTRRLSFGHIVLLAV